jgi:SAM-dependent methyltransferase
MSTEAPPASAGLLDPSRFNVKEELVLLVRGFFATPILSALARLGALDAMAARSSFVAADFSDIPNTALLDAALRYLLRAGLLESVPEQDAGYRVTELGRQIFRRWSSFLPPHSYKDYMHHFFDDLQIADAHAQREVDRFENILGSGRTHERYFPSLLSFIRRRIPCDTLVDVGCGDGQFLEHAMRALPATQAVGIDLSPVSVTATQARLQTTFPGRASLTAVANATDIASWSEAVARIGQSSQLVISMWFVLHEISHRDPHLVEQFLIQVHRRYPTAHLVVGELVRNDAALLARRRKDSIMPEYLLFHDLSGQGPLTWREYRSVLAGIPYRLAFEQRFDELESPGSEKEPATFVWLLSPL